MALDLPAEGPEGRRFTVRLDDVRAGPWRVPSLVVAGAIGPDMVQIDEVQAPYLPGEIDVQAHLRFAGPIDVRLRARLPRLAAEPNLHRLLPTLRASLSGIAEVTLYPGPVPRLDAQVDARLEQVAFRGLSAGMLSVRGEARGELRAPVVRLEVSGRALESGAARLAALHLHVEGGPRHYRIAGTVDEGDGRSGEIDATITRTEESVRLDDARFRLQVQGSSLRGLAHDVELAPGRFLRVASLVVASGSQRMSVHGIYRFDGRLDMEATLQDVNLDLLRLLPFEMPHLRGSIDMHAQLRGTTKRPDLLVTGVYHAGVVFGIAFATGAYYLRYDGRRGYFETDGDFDFGPGHGGLTCHAEARFRPGAGPRASLERATWEATVEPKNLDASLFHELLPSKVAAVTGSLDGKIVARGTLARPNVEAHLRGTGLALPGSDVFRASLDATYEASHLALRASVSDESGLLARVEGRLDADLVRLLRSPKRPDSALRTGPWQVSVDVPPMRLDELPRPLDALVHMPVRASLVANLTGGPRTPAHGTATLHATWLDLIPETRLHSVTCARDVSPELTVDSTIGARAIEMHAVGRTAGRDVLAADLRTALSLDALASGQVPSSFPPVDARLRLTDAPLRDMPFVCGYSAGTVTAELNVHQLLGRATTADLRARSKDLSVLGEAPLDVALDAHAAPTTLSAHLEARGPCGGLILLDGHVATVWRGTPTPRLAPHSPLAASLELRRAPVAPLLGLLPMVREPSGTIDGRVEVRGTAQAPVLSGALHLHDVALSVIGPGQYYSGVNGRILFHGNWVELSKLEAHDGDGLVRVSGGVGLRGIVPDHARLAVYAHAFPARREGIVMSTVTAQALVQATFAPHAATVNVKVTHLDVRVPNEAPRKVQNLAPHPDVVLVGVKNAQGPPSAGTPYALEIHIDASHPFWVRRQDFSAQLTARLTLHILPEELRIHGEVDLRQGFLDLMGKRFALKEGQVLFRGGREVNPVVHVVATHNVDGDTLTVTVSGSLNDPHLDFASTRSGSLTAGDALAELVGGGQGAGSSMTAQEQASSFLNGITAGVLTLAARNEFGGVLPVVSVQASATSARLVAGFRADQIIPQALRNIVRGVYVEGYVETPTSQQETGNNGFPGGVRLQIDLPANLQTTADFNGPTTFSVDLIWQL